MKPVITHEAWAASSSPSPPLRLWPSTQIPLPPSFAHLVNRRLVAVMKLLFQMRRWLSLLTITYKQVWTRHVMTDHSNTFS